MTGRVLALIFLAIPLQCQETVTEPLDFWGLEGMRLPLVSQRALSWTDTRFSLQGADITDPYQPGRMIGLPVSITEPDAVWHTRVSSSDAGPGPARPLAERFHWFTREDLETGGLLGKRADVLFSASGQWASQARDGEDLNSRVLLSGARGRVQLTDRDQIEALFSGSRIHLSNLGIPAGLEAAA